MYFKRRSKEIGPFCEIDLRPILARDAIVFLMKKDRFFLTRYSSNFSWFL